MATQVNIHEAKTHFSKLVDKAIAGREAVRSPVTEAVIVLMDPRDRRGNWLELEPAVDKVAGELGEGLRVKLERLPAVGAELRVVGVRPPAIAAVDGRSRRRCCAARGRGRHGRLFLTARRIAEGAYALAELAENLRQPAGAEDDQHDGEDEKELRPTDVRHSFPPDARLRALGLTNSLGEQSFQQPEE